MLTAVRDYLQSVEAASVWQCAKQLNIELKLAKDFIDYWQAKGRVMKYAGSSCGQSCQGCPPELKTLYCWCA